MAIFHISSSLLPAAGNFSAPKAQEIVVSRGKVLELLRPDDETGKVLSVVATEVFGQIRCLEAFRLVTIDASHAVSPASAASSDSSVADLIMLFVWFCMACRWAGRGITS